MPRRAQISNLAPELAGAYADAAVPQAITGVSGVILLVAVILYFTVLFGTLFSRSRVEVDTPAIPFAQTVELRSEGVMRLLDNLTAWFALAVFLVAVAYGPTLLSMWFDQVRVPGLRLW